MKYDKYERLGAYHYDWYNDTNWAWYKKCVDRIVSFCAGSTIDAGCGDGLVTSKLDYPSVGIDNEQTGLDLCSTPTLKADLNNDFQIPVGYSYVCSLNTIEHLKTPKMIVRLVKMAKRGAIIITDMPSKNKGRYHEHEYTKQELLDTFKEFKPKYFVINSTEFGKPITFHGVEIVK